MRLVADLETDGLLDKVTKIHCLVAIDLDSKQVHRFTPDTIGKGIELLEKAEELVFHNGICYDLPVIRKLYPESNIRAKIVDTLVFSKLAYLNLAELDFRMIKKGKLDSITFTINRSGKTVSAVGSHSLEAWGKRLKFFKGDYGKQDNAWDHFSQEMLDYCEQDVWLTIKLLEKLETKGVPEDALDLEHKVQEIIFKQEQRGWVFDRECGQQLYATLCQRRAELGLELSKVFPGWTQDMRTPKYYYVDIRGKIYKAPSKGELIDLVRDRYSNNINIKLTKSWLMKNSKPSEERNTKHIPFNPASRKHIHRALEEKYGWRPQEFTETGEAKVDESVLKSLEYPEAKLLNEYFTVLKRIGQLAEGDQNWLDAVKDNGRIHGRCNPLGAGTSRATHSNPNLAQVPAAGSPYGKECRSLFKVARGYKQVGADAEGQELRCLAHYMYPWDNGRYAEAVVSGRKEEGTDVHTMNMKASGVPSRDDAKTMIYAFIYGAGDGKMGSIIMPEGEERKRKRAGKRLKEKLFDATPGLREIVEYYKGMAEEHGYIISLDGRRIPVSSSHAALNYLLQSTGAIITKRWMVIIDDLINQRGLGDKVFQVAFIHDELQFEVLKGYEDQFSDICKEAMVLAERYYNFKCPLSAGVAIGDNWYECH